MKQAPHGFKYSLVYVVNGTRVVGYDNERGKGDHRHFLNKETPYGFIDVATLFSDFKADIAAVSACGTYCVRDDLSKNECFKNVIYDAEQTF